MREPVSFTFEQLWYTVETNLKGKPATPIDKLQKRTAKRDLLLDVKAEVSSGHVLAILGPSGAGKVRHRMKRARVPCNYSPTAAVRTTRPRF